MTPALAVSIGAVATVGSMWSAFTDRRDVTETLTVLTVALALAPMIRPWPAMTTPSSRPPRCRGHDAGCCT